jgi:hypothetical protein
MKILSSPSKISFHFDMSVLELMYSIPISKHREYTFHNLFLLIELITNSFYLIRFYNTVKTIRMFILADHHKSIATF